MQGLPPISKAPLFGVLYVAQGIDYAELAVQSAMSLRALEPCCPMDIVTDVEPPSGLFDAVLPLGDMSAQVSTRAKIVGMQKTRFERTLFLDCDTLVVGPICEAFDLLERFDLCLSHDVRRSSKLITTGWRENPPEIFGQHNSGVFLYKKSPAMMRFLQDWAESYCLAQSERDQVSLRDLLWRSDVRFWVLPPEFNLRRVSEVDIWQPLDAIPRIIHSHHLLRHLRGEGERVCSFDEILELERQENAKEWDHLAKRLKEDYPSDILKRFLKARDHRQE